MQRKACLWTELDFGSCVCSESPALGQNTHDDDDDDGGDDDDDDDDGIY